MENVSWEEAEEFCKKLSAREKEKRVYILPTEAQWEYACRGGAGLKTPYHFGKTLSSTQANFDYRKLGRTCAVGSYRPNAFGLYDMHGNVREWCSDWYGAKYYADSPASDPPGPSEGSNRVSRGGSWDNNGRTCRSARRSWFTPTYRSSIVGFRVALVPSK